MNAFYVSGVQPKVWNLTICTNLKFSFIKGDYTNSIDVSETVPILNFAVYESGKRLKKAYTSIRILFGAIVEIVVYKKWPRSMRLIVFDHQTFFWLPNRLFWSDLAHFLWANYKVDIVGDKRKRIGSSEPFHFGQSFTNFQKNVRARWGLTCFITEIFLVNKSSIMIQLSSFFLGRLHLSHRFHLRHVLTNLPKSVRARWGLAFSITKLRFGQ